MQTQQLYGHIFNVMKTADLGSFVDTFRLPELKITKTADLQQFMDTFWLSELIFIPGVHKTADLSSFMDTFGQSVESVHKTAKVRSFCNFELRQPKSVHKTAQVRSFLDIENVSIKLLRSAVLSTQISVHRTAKVRSFMDTLKYCHIWQESLSVVSTIQFVLVGWQSHYHVKPTNI